MAGEETLFETSTGMGISRMAHHVKQRSEAFKYALQTLRERAGKAQGEGREHHDVEH